MTVKQGTNFWGKRSNTKGPILLRVQFKLFEPIKAHWASYCGGFASFYRFKRLRQGVPSARLYFQVHRRGCIFPRPSSRHLRHAPGRAARGQADDRRPPRSYPRSTLVVMPEHSGGKIINKRPSTGEWRTKWGSGWTEYFRLEWPTKERMERPRRPE